MVNQVLQNLGYAKEEIEKIVGTYSLLRYTDSTLVKKIIENYNFLLGLDFSRKDILKMTVAVPEIWGYSIDSMNQKMDFLKSLGNNFDSSYSEIPRGLLYPSRA